MIVMDRQDYINKSNSLLVQLVYRPIPRDPTNKMKAKLITMLRKFEEQTGLESNTYKSMYRTGCSAPKFHGIPKIHKLYTASGQWCPAKDWSPIEWPRYLPKYLNHWLVIPHHIHGTQDFVEQANKVSLLPGDCLSSYDVTALITSVPVDPALTIIKDLLEKDNTLKETRVLPGKDIILLLEFCLKNTYFSLHGQFYEQVEDAAMDFSVSPIVANIYIEYFEQKALSTATHPPQNVAQVCGWYICHPKGDHKQNILENINNVDQVVTVEDNKEDGAIPFLDTIVNPEADDRFVTCKEFE